jgi:hypothetical protein
MAFMQAVHEHNDENSRREFLGSYLLSQSDTDNWDPLVILNALPSKTLIVENAETSTLPS